MTDTRESETYDQDLTSTLRSQLMRKLDDGALVA
jgi:hypothetical protein